MSRTRDDTPRTLLRGTSLSLDPNADPRADATWPRRLQLAIADYLDGGTNHHDGGTNHHQDMLAGIHLYQQLLGLRAHDVLRRRVGDGWWIGRPLRHQRHPHQITTSASRPATRYRLAVDPTRAPTVPVIFDWTLRHGLTARQVAGRLATDPQRHPLPTDGISTQPWPRTPDVVRGILTNPAYLGYSV